MYIWCSLSTKIISTYSFLSTTQEFAFPFYCNHPLIQAQFVFLRSKQDICHWPVLCNVINKNKFLFFINFCLSKFFSQGEKGVVIQLIQWQGLLSKLLLKLGWNQIVMAISYCDAFDINSKWCPEVPLVKCCTTCKLQLDWICLYFLWSQFYAY